MKKHVITKLKLNEISGVDRPAQVGAVVSLMKRADPPKDPQETSMFKTREELLAAISKALTTAPSKDEAVNIVKSAEALEATDTVPLSISKAAGCAPDEMDTPAGKKMKKELAKTNSILALSAVEKAFYDGLKDDTAKDAFLAKSADDRTVEINKAKGDDPVLYTTMDGQDIRKSAGDLMLNLAKRNDQLAKDLLVEKAARHDEALTKRAETDLSKLAGDVGTRKALLKAVDGIADETVRTEVMKTLAAANTAMGGAFSKGGGNDNPKLEKAAGSPEEAETKLDELAKNLQKADAKLDYPTAYSKALDTTEGRALYKALQAN